MNDQLYALLWSKRQNCFHVEPLIHTLKTNVTAFLRDSDLDDYHILFVGSKEQVYESSEKHRKVLIGRENVAATH